MKKKAAESAARSATKKAAAKKAAANKSTPSMSSTKKSAAAKKPATSKKAATTTSSTKKSAAAKKAATSKKAAAMKARPSLRPGPDGVVRLSGGNPQVAKGDGDGPVQAYIEAMPGWMSMLGRRVDAIVVKAVPGVRKAVKWNSPFWGAPDNVGWFMNLHVFSKYVKIAFFYGTSLQPMPPGASKMKTVRFFDVRENDEIDEAQLTAWVKQAAAIPGWMP